MARRSTPTGCGYEEPGAGTACYFPAPDHAEFKWSKALLSLAIVAFGLVASWVVCVQLYTRRRGFFVGLTQRFAPARWGYTFLVNKYYLDALYENVIVAVDRPPDRQGVYWTNQNILDGIVNGAGIGGKRSVSGCTATSTSASSTESSTARAPSPVRPGTPFNRSSRAGSTSTARCCSPPPPCSPSSSSS